jgi:hypothetical protein
MDEPSPDTQPDGPKPEVDEGQVPAGEVTPDVQPDADTGGRTYSESYVKQLRREAQGNRQRLSELEEKLQEYEDRDKSETQRLTESVTAAERRAAQSEERLLRYEIVAERNLPMTAAAFLTGTTREEMELRAEELEKLLAEQGRPATGGYDGGARAPVPDTRSPEEAHNDLLMRSLGREPRR